MKEKKLEGEVFERDRPLVPRRFLLSLIKESRARESAESPWFMYRNIKNCFACCGQFLSSRIIDTGVSRGKILMHVVGVTLFIEFEGMLHFFEIKTFVSKVYFLHLQLYFTIQRQSEL